MDDENNNYDIRTLILQAIGEEKNSLFLELCYVIYEAEDKRVEAKKILSILNDEKLMRKIRRLEALTEESENKIYYYDDNKLGVDKLFYDSETEVFLRGVRNKNLSSLAKLLKSLNDEQIEL